MGIFHLNHEEAGSWPSFVLSLDGERRLAAEQRRRIRPGPRPAGPIAVSLHAFHIELVPALLDRLEASGLADAHLWISTDTDAKVHELAALLAGRPRWDPATCHIDRFENRGRNVWPLLQQLSDPLQGYGAVLHLHTKRTQKQDGLGEAWREHLLDILIGSADQVRIALAHLADPSVGLVLPCRFAGINRFYKWGIEFAAARAVLRDLYPDRLLLPSHLLVFPAGMMFWLRPACLLGLARLITADADSYRFAPEPLPTRGTLAHALERCLCQAVEAGGHGWRLLDRADAPAWTAANDEPQDGLAIPSLWGGTEDAYFLELARMTGRLQRLERQVRQPPTVAPPPAPARGGHWRWPRWLGGPPPPPLRVALVLPAAGRGYTSSAYLRLLLPLAPLQQRRLCQLHTVGRSSDAALAACDVVVVQRAALSSRREVRRWRQRCDDLGLPLVLDLDDALFTIGSDHPQAASLQSSVAVIDALLGAVDHLLVSTPELGRACRRRAARRGRRLPGVTVIANGLDAPLWGGPDPGAGPGSPPPAGGRFRLLYMGSPTHDPDFALVLEALDALERTRPGRFELVMVGGLAAPVERDWLIRLDIPLDRRRYPAFVPWLRDQPACHLGLAPLVDNRFNRCKSDLKVLDYAALGLACLCSDLPPYAGLIRRRLAIPVAADGWRQALEQAIDHRLPLQRTAARARRHLWRRRRSDQAGRQLLALLRAVVSSSQV